MSSRPLAVVILTILVVLQLLAFAPEFSRCCSIFSKISLLVGDKYIISDGSENIDAASYSFDPGRDLNLPVVDDEFDVSNIHPSEE